MIELKNWSNKIENRQSFPYLQYTPLNFEAESDKKWPLIICLHGAGERGNDGWSILGHLPFNHAKPEEGEGLPCFMVAPQCPENKFWNCFIESLNDFLDDILENLPIDRNRVYLTGLSMGGTGTWCWSIANPERFAAVAPICGTGVYWYAENLVNKPLWAFHGTADDIVPVNESLNMIGRIRQLGGNPMLTLYDNVGHDSWVQAYSNPELYKWMLSQSL